MARVLITVHLGRHFRIFGHYDYKVLLDMGHEVHIAANFKNEIDQFEDPRVIKHQIDFDRNPFSFSNILAYKQLRDLLKRYKYDLIHTQSPSGGAITRLAARNERKNGTKLIYTAHGFHFFKGAPLKNWLLYYPIEKWLSKFTDCLLTINDEDFNCAMKKGFKFNYVFKINGVGIDLNKFKPQTEEKKKELRTDYGFRDEDFILIYVAELSNRKNQEMIINVINKLKKEIKNIKLLLVGTGKYKNKYQNKVKKKCLEENVLFLGYRKDVPNLMLLSDIAVSTSKQEGLPLNVMEAMATGLPLVVTDCRGNRDLVKNDENGYVVKVNDIDEFANKVIKLYSSADLREKFSNSSLIKIQDFSVEKVTNEMKRIYNLFLKNK